MCECNCCVNWVITTRFVPGPGRSTGGTGNGSRYFVSASPFSRDAGFLAKKNPPAVPASPAFRNDRLFIIFVFFLEIGWHAPAQASGCRNSLLPACHT